MSGATTFSLKLHCRNRQQHVAPQRQNDVCIVLCIGFAFCKWGKPTKSESELMSKISTSLNNIPQPLHCLQTRGNRGARGRTSSSITTTKGLLGFGLRPMIAWRLLPSLTFPFHFSRHKKHLETWSGRRPQRRRVSHHHAQHRPIRPSSYNAEAPSTSSAFLLTAELVSTIEASELVNIPLFSSLQ